jgi:TrmH family RNA methyltransferase
MTPMPDRIRITSPQNERVKDLVRLRDRRHRDRSGTFPVEGARETARALDAGVELREAYVCPGLLQRDARAVVGRLEDAGLPIVELAEPAFRKASYREAPDGILVVASAWSHRLEDLELADEPLLLVIDGLEKPGNVGALLRTADAAGATAVFLTGAGTDVFNPNVIRASMGSVFARPVVPAAVPDLAAWLAARSIRVLATSPGAERAFWDADLRGPTAIVVGSEHRGLEADWLSAADLRVRIPMRGMADSLNVATAGALLLYEALRQRGGAV